jgi:hypothetical protein
MIHGKIMSFTIGKKTIKCNVEFIAEGDMGEEVNASIVIVYKRPSVSEGKQFSKLNAQFADAIRAMTDEGSQASIEARSEKVNSLEQQMSDFVRERITGWERVFGPDMGDLEFNQENLESLFDDRDARRAIFSRYQELVTGRKQAAEKNSESSDAAG